jgi:hypothetical protein
MRVRARHSHTFPDGSVLVAGVQGTLEGIDNSQLRVRWDRIEAESGNELNRLTPPAIVEVV